MPIQVQGPDGQMLEFPDGTPRETMKSAMQKRYGGPQQSASVGNVQSKATSSVGNVQSKATVPQAPPEASMGQSVQRGLGLGARAMLQGGADLVGIVADPVIVGMNKLGANQATMRQGAGMLADRMGLPTPESAGERVSGDVTSALTGGGAIVGLGRQAAMRAPGVVQRVGESIASMPGSQVASLTASSGAAGVTREAGGSPVAQTVAGLGAGIGTPFGIAGLQAATRGVLRGRQPVDEFGVNPMQRTINDFRAVGAEPSAGQAAGRWRTRGLENLLAGGPTSGGVMTRFAERQAEDIGGGLQKLADDFRPAASAEKAGRAVQEGVDTFTKNVRAQRNALYWQADQFIPQTTASTLKNTWSAVVDLTTPTPGAIATTGDRINPKLLKMRGSLEQDLAAGGGALPYDAVKKLRTSIGEQLDEFTLTPDTSKRELDSLYGALSRDMEDAARRQGPDAVRAMQRANTYTRVSSKRLEQLERVVDKNGGGEAVYNAVMLGSREGGTRLREVMRSLPKDGQRALTAAVIKRMGLAKPSQGTNIDSAEFSAETFLTNWRTVSPEARRALFDRHGPKFTANMDRVARVAANIREGSRVFANPSGSANKGAAYAYIGTLAVSVLNPMSFALTAGAGLSANFAARAMTNPKFVSWLARNTEAPISALPQQVVALKNIAKMENDEEMMRFAESLEPQKVEQPGNAP